MTASLDWNHPPFDLLDADVRAQAPALEQVEFEAGSEILGAGGQTDRVLVIASGQVQALDPRGREGEQVFAELLPGDLFGSHAVLSGRARHAYRAATATSCFVIPAPLFRRWVSEQPRFGAWFSEGMAIKRKRRAADDGAGDIGRLLLVSAAEAHPAPVVRVNGQCSIADATRRLRDRGVDALIVDDAALGPGVVTRTDLLEALALDFLRPEAAVGPLASRPLIAVDASAPLFQALVLMTEAHVERVAVRQDGQILGTLGVAEVLANLAASSQLLVWQINRASSVAQIADAAAGMPALIAQLFRQGARMRVLAEMVTALNGRILKRLYELVIPASMQDALCLLVLGSEGRGEQFLRTDQDNALVLGEGIDDAAVAPHAEALSAAIEACGWPPCKGGVMLRNANWRGQPGEWSARVRRWLATPDPDAMMNLAILVDARPVAGRIGLADPLRAALQQGLGNDIALRGFAEAALRFHAPLTWFGRIRSADGGTDLKKGAIFPIVHGLRSMALANGIEARNSFARAEALIAAGQLSASFGKDLQQALSVCLRLRLAAQLDNLAQDAGSQAETPDNRIHTEALRRLDRELLRDALRVVKEFQELLAQRFRLSG